MRRIKGKQPKKVNISEINLMKYKDSKSIANKIGDTLAELSQPQKYEPTFLDLERRK